MHHTKLIRALATLFLVSSFAARARADALPPTPLIQGDFLWEPSDDIDHEACTLLVDGAQFAAQLNIDSTDGVQEVSLNFDALQPTSISRGTDKVSVKQNQWVAMSVTVGAVDTLSQAPMEKCSLSASFAESKSKGQTTLSCKGDNLSDQLSDDEIASVQTALAGLPHVKFKVDAAHHKWSITSQCSGVFTP